MCKIKFLSCIAMCFAFFSASSASIFDNEIDCSFMNEVKEFEGHYYATSNYSMGYEEAIILTEDSNAYLAVPDSKEENEFLSKLISDEMNGAAFIGIYDKTYTANYCFNNDKCVFDDARFRTVLNKPIYYKNWAKNEPNNLTNENDDNKNFSKFKGEHYVIIRQNGKWADVAFNKRFHAIFEFNEAPSCFKAEIGGQK